jgi:hypothetical protein
MKVKLLFALLLTTIFCNAQTDEDAIRSVVTSAYIQGIHNRGSTDDIRKGFHPSFAMLRLVQNEIKPLPIEEWIAALEKLKRKMLLLSRRQKESL